jgi:hypothetical protein
MDKTVSYEAGQVRFSVEESFKGDLKGEITVSVNSHKNTSCGPYGLIRGERYLVYAHGESNGLNTGVCTRTRLISSIKADDEDLQFLRTIPRGVHQGRIAGSVLVNDPIETNPIEGMIILLHFEKDQVIKKTTDTKGRFEFSDLKPGRYDVEALWPEYISNDSTQRSVSVQNKRCTPVEFSGSFESSLRGRIVDINLHPAAVPLNITRAGSQPEIRRDPTIYPDMEGKFHFERLAPGSYVVYLELRAEDQERNQRYFYPGVKEIEKATLIKIGPDQKLEDIEFKLPAEFAILTIEGRVLQIDGTPVSGVHVRLLCPKNLKNDGPVLNLMHYPGHTDEKGYFRLSAVKGITYRLQATNDTDASLMKKETPDMRSPVRLLTPEQDIYDIELVLSEPGGFDFKCDTSKGRSSQP